MKKLLILTVLVFAILAAGCDRALKTQIAGYQGDGEIRYLKSPGLLGISGCDIKMPSFDLSKPFYAEYDLLGLPNAKAKYVVYLVV